MTLESRTAGATILVVDDDPIVRAVLLPLLSKGGYTVIAAEGGAQGIEYFASHAGQIDLVVSDITMPEIDGIQMVEKIRRCRPDARVLFISGCGHTLPPWAHETCAFLLKPFRVTGLLDAVDACLSRPAGRSANA
jgi:CheY-like chemotaxis protein